MGNLVLATDLEVFPPGEHRDEIERMTASIQSWANSGNVDVSGYSRFAGQPRFRVVLQNDLSIADNTDTAITWPLTNGKQIYDNGASHDQAFLPVAGTSIRFPHRAGVYHVVTTAVWAANATGFRSVRLTFTDENNLSYDFSGSQMPAGSAANLFIQQGSHYLDIKEGPGGRWPSVKVVVLQSSGGPLNLGGANDSGGDTSVTIVKVA